MKTTVSSQAAWPFPLGDMKLKPNSVSADVAKYAAVREATGAPMIVCKKALKAAGNYDDAVRLLYILDQCNVGLPADIVERARTVKVGAAQVKKVQAEISVPMPYVVRALLLSRADVAEAVRFLHRLMPAAGVVLDTLAVKNRDLSSSVTSGASGREELQADLPVGAHLITPRTGYAHHGIYVGDGTVIHYSGLADGLSAGPIEETSLANFQAGRELRVRDYKKAKYTGWAAVKRARSRLGEDEYDLQTNNCEHFCSWVVIGKSVSRQVETVENVVTLVAPPILSAAIKARKHVKQTPGDENSTVSEAAGDLAKIGGRMLLTTVTPIGLPVYGAFKLVKWMVK